MDSSDSESGQWLLQAILFLLQPETITIFLGYSIIALLLICSALISGAEVAFFSLGPTEIHELRSNGARKNSMILNLLDHPKTLLATILVGNNLVNVAIVILFAFITSKIVDPLVNPTLIIIFNVVILTFLLVLFGEIIPKVYATRNAMKLAGIMALPVTLMSKVFYPISKLLIYSTSFIEKKFKRRTDDISVDDLSHALELTSSGEESTADEQRILKGIVRFGNIDVKQIMKSRVDVVTFDYETQFDVLIEKILESGYSRVPVYKENFDNVAGILTIKDLLPHLDKGPEFKWQDLLRTSIYVPESKKIDDLLKEFQDKKNHMAIVVDEYGGTSGIVTLEDIIEEIVGEINDEFDDEELVYSKLDEKNYVFEGKTLLNDFCRVLDIEENPFEEVKGDADTLAGLILELTGKMPDKNEELVYEKFKFKIESVDKRRIKRLKVTILDQEEVGSEE